MKRKKLFMCIALSVLFILSCGSDTSPSGDSDTLPNRDQDSYSDEDAVGTPECKTPGEAPIDITFTEVTEELGFGKGKMEVTGNTASSLDFDNDGFPDLLLVSGKREREDSEDPKGYYRLLHNTGGNGFEDVTFSSGLFTARDGHKGRETSYIVWGDFNNDGLTDAVHVRYFDKNDKDEPYDATELYINKGNGSFKPGPKNDFSVDYFNPLTGGAVADFDVDGNLDIFFGRHYAEYGNLSSCLQNSLYVGDGTGHFKDATPGSGLETKPFSEQTAEAGTNHKPTWGVAACDMDGDGLDEILTTSYGRQYNEIYHNEGNGTFTDYSVTSGFAHDNNENYNDNQFFACYCAAHPDAGEYCANAEKPVISCDGMENAFHPGMDDKPWRLGGNSSASVCADFNNDGKMDVVSVELAHWHIGQSSDKTQLLINQGFPEKPFERIPEKESGITRPRAGGWNDGDLGGIAADFDNDGRMDVLILSSDYPDTTALLYQQQKDGTFKEIAEKAGIKLNRAHGGTVFDYDRDGDLDVVMGTSLMRWTANDRPPKPEKAWVHIYRNDTPVGNRIAILLKGDPEQGCNSNAIGARIVVKAGGKQFVREVQSGYGIWGFSNDFEQIIGIGNECHIDSIEIHWPNKAHSVTTIQDIEANYRLIISQKTGKAEKQAVLP